MLGFGLLGQQPDLTLEVSRIVELFVDADEADVCHLVDLAQLLEHRHADLLTAQLRTIETQRLLEELATDFEILMTQSPARAKPERSVGLGDGSFDALERFTLSLENRFRTLRFDEQPFV